MMKRALLYAATAILLGAVTMVVPLMLLKPDYYELITQGRENIPKGSPAFLEALDGGEGTFAGGGSLERAVSPSNLSSTGLMLIPSLLLALGVYLYFKKRLRSRMLG